MYDSIYVPVDNSDYANAAMQLAFSLGEHCRAKIVGCHVYAAQLHDVRFKQMEFTLPDEYREETELEKQRRIHDALIARGLNLISKSYLDRAKDVAMERGLAFESKHFDGKNYVALVDDINASDYDLVMLGALGQGAVGHSQVGSVCERILRRTQRDTWIVRNLIVRNLTAKALHTRDARDAEATQSPIVACLDGSAHSYGALRIACNLAGMLNTPLEIVAVAAFDQEKALLERHLTLASAFASRQGALAATHLFCGQVVASLRAYTEEVNPFVVAIGRCGIDATSDRDIGQTAEALVRKLACDVLLTHRPYPAADIRTEVSVAASMPAAG